MAYHGSAGWKRTCLAITPHSGDDVTDPILHYFGCLRLSERAIYYDSLATPQQRSIRAECRRILSSALLLRTEERQSKAHYLFRRSLDPLTPPASDVDSQHGGLDCVCGRCEVDAHSNTAALDAGDHILAPVVLFKRQPGKSGQAEELLPFSSTSCYNSWPDQKVPLWQLFTARPEDPLAAKCPSDIIRWFHVPATVTWIEHILEAATSKADTAFFEHGIWGGRRHGVASTPRHLQSFCRADFRNGIRLTATLQRLID